MEKIEKFTEESFSLAKDFAPYLKEFKIGILDIETTGLSQFSNKIILAGLLTYSQQGQGILSQYFLDSLEDETLLLEAYLEDIKDLDVIVTYNGTTFDLPFIRGRAKKLGLPLEKDPFHLDLYLLFKKFSDLKKLLPNLKQKTVEDFLGLAGQRQDLISGADSILLYQNYLSSKDPSLKEKVLLHNCDDLKQLGRIFQACRMETIDIHQGFFDMGFPVRQGLYVKTIKAMGKHLKVIGVQQKKAFTYYSFEDGVRALNTVFKKDEGTFSLDIPFMEKEDAIFVKLSNLDLDRQAFLEDPLADQGFLLLGSRSRLNYYLINKLTKELLLRIEASS